MILSYTISTEDHYSHIKELLKEYFQISDRLLLKLKKNQSILLNDKVTSVNAILSVGDTIKVLLNHPEDNSNIVSIKMDLAILYEDEGLLILNKPAGIPVHPSMEHYDSSLSNGVKFYFDQIGLEKKIRPVNRIDKNTSGIVVFAKNEYIQECLIRQMKSGDFEKKYIAICENKFQKKQGTIDLPIARKPDSIIERCISDSGEFAKTYYTVLFECEDYSIVSCKLETGRTHQIRVHLASIGHPLLGDTLYGNSSSFIGRQALHAYKIKFVHPVYKKLVDYTAPLPDDMRSLIPISLL